MIINNIHFFAKLSVNRQGQNIDYNMSFDAVYLGELKSLKLTCSAASVPFNMTDNNWVPVILKWPPIT